MSYKMNNIYFNAPQLVDGEVGTCFQMGKNLGGIERKGVRWLPAKFVYM